MKSNLTSKFDSVLSLTPLTPFCIISHSPYPFLRAYGMGNVKWCYDKKQQEEGVVFMVL